MFVILNSIQVWLDCTDLCLANKVLRFAEINRLDKWSRVFDNRGMSNAAILDQLMKALNGVLPPGLTDDIRTNMEAVLKARLTDLGLVTREEFEIQSALLARTQDKLKQLEELTRELEQKLNQ